MNVETMEVNTAATDTETELRIQGLGLLSISATAYKTLIENDQELIELLERFVKGDYGNTGQDPFEADKAMYLKQGECKASYTLKDGRTVLITTGFCRVVTEIKESNENVQGDT